MTAITVTLPWSCVRHDNHRLIPARNRRGLVQAKGYRDAKANARTIAAAQVKRMLRGNLELFAWCYFPDKRKRDAGNYRKLITDALSGIAYDDDAQLVKETWSRIGYDNENPRIEITVQEVVA